MEPVYYDAAGHIDYGAAKACAGELRQAAIDAFWSALVAAVAHIAARWGQDAARTAASAQRVQGVSRQP